MTHPGPLWAAEMGKSGHGGHPSSVHQERFLEMLCAGSQNGKSVKNWVTVPCLSVCLFSISFLYPSGSCIFPESSRGSNGPLSIRMSAFSAYTLKGPNLPVFLLQAWMTGLQDHVCMHAVFEELPLEKNCAWRLFWLFVFAWHRCGEMIWILMYHMHLWLLVKY